MGLARHSQQMPCLLSCLLLLSLLSLGSAVVDPTWTQLDAPGTHEDLVHPCLRICQKGDQRVCFYKLTVEHYSTMGEACGDCPFTPGDCGRPGCVAADGMTRKLVTANRRLSGPIIHVCQGDEVEVEVENRLEVEGTSIHWHGIHQHGTPYMDGVPHLTQCPILPGDTFKYKFTAHEPGTHYWHSHSGFQRTDGLFGSLVVHQAASTDPHAHLYDTDLPQHLLVLTDWLKDLSHILYDSLHLAPDEDKPHNILVNGKGPYQAFKKGREEEAFTPLHEVTVTPGTRHRFRVMSNSVRNCPIVVSVDQHKLLIIASDGHPIQPVEVESFTIYGGERWDFVLTADQDPGAYWMKFQGVMHCGTRHKSAYQVGVLRYEGAKGYPGSVKRMTYLSTIRKGYTINTMDAAPGDLTFLTAAEVRALTPAQDDIARAPDHTFYLTFDFYMDKSTSHIKVQMNGITFVLPPAPPLSQPESINASAFCSAEDRGECGDEGVCSCTHLLSVDMDSLVEVVLVDQSYVNHPFHIHGLAFYVIAMGQLGDEATVERFQELDAAGEVQRNFDHPPLKDTVTVPSGGYVVIRFFANNPGYWLFHCHLSFHVEMGMSLVFRVGDDSMLPPVPEGFPRC
ncbi:uncharacterized protein LOC126981839 [Eriocheir sinensis]|uniref:uncharacterized protein LOC126981839 n=1 Tax=Eriocheir sinensis TaxID=95602 RepID=UPI0021C64A16|nr:uncharacterized protein LOC126981839 [Eriocheir sinensis]